MVSLIGRLGAEGLLSLDVEGVARCPSDALSDVTRVVSLIPRLGAEGLLSLDAEGWSVA